MPGRKVHCAKSRLRWMWLFFFLNLQIKKALKGVRVEVTHRGDARRKYRIATLTQSGPSVME